MLIIQGEWFDVYYGAKQGLLDVVFHSLRHTSVYEEKIKSS